VAPASGENPQRPTIIVGYDGRSTSDDALALGARLAEPAGAQLLLVFAYGVEALGPAPDPDWIGISPHDAAERILRRGLEAVPPGIVARICAIPDAPAGGVLDDLADEEHASAIVVGSTQRGPISRVLIGSVAEQLLRGARCAVAVAPREFGKREPRPLTRLAVGWDGSDGAGVALDIAGELAQIGSGMVHVYTAINPRALGYPLADDEPGRRGAEQLLADAAQRLPEEIPAGAKVLEGEPAAALVREAEKDDIDLLLLGSRGLGPARRVLLGSVSDTLVRTAPCAVMIVPKGIERLYG
jgi:nucleotide-binding universal stress UspA family protein